MKIALTEASVAASNHEVPVGCVIVYKNTIIAKGHNLTNISNNPLRHAEIVAFEELEKNIPNINPSELTLYVTIEPCIMCANFLYFKKIEKVIFGARNPKFGGLGSVFDSSSLFNPINPINQNHSPDKINRTKRCKVEDPYRGYEIIEGVLEKETIRILTDFFDLPNIHHPSTL